MTKKKKQYMNKDKILYLSRKDVALDDMATAILIYRKAREKGIGTQLKL